VNIHLMPRRIHFWSPTFPLAQRLRCSHHEQKALPSARSIIHSNSVGKQKCFMEGKASGLWPYIYVPRIHFWSHREDSSNILRLTFVKCGFFWSKAVGFNLRYAYPLGGSKTSYTNQNETQELLEPWISHAMPYMTQLVTYTLSLAFATHVTPGSSR
jgi:hypothetical protein